MGASMKFLKFTFTTVIISTVSMLAGSHIHARAVDNSTPNQSSQLQPQLQLSYLPVLSQAGVKSQTLQLSPELRNALLVEIQRQAPIINAVIVITPQGEVQYLGNLKNSQSAELTSPYDPPRGRRGQEEWNGHDGPGPGGKTFRKTNDEN
jgi:hypothetical protein